MYFTTQAFRLPRMTLDGIVATSYQYCISQCFRPMLNQYVNVKCLFSMIFQYAYFVELPNTPRGSSSSTALLLPYLVFSSSLLQLNDPLGLGISTKYSRSLESICILKDHREYAFNIHIVVQHSPKTLREAVLIRCSYYVIESHSS